MSKSDDMRRLLDLTSGKAPITETIQSGTPFKSFADWGKLDESAIVDEAWAGEPAADSINVYQDKDPMGTGQWFWTRSHDGHIIASGSCPTEEEANVQAYGPIDEAAEVHLLRPRGGSECGAPVDGDDDNFTAEINDVTCPACLKGHDEYMSQFEHNDEGDLDEEDTYLDRMYDAHRSSMGGFEYHTDRFLEEGWECPNCGNTDQDGGDNCVDCGAEIEDTSDSEGGIESDIVTGPAAWASYLINGDDSSMSTEDLAACEEWQRRMEPFYVVSMTDDEPRFTNSYRLHGGTAEGGDVVDYIVHKINGPQLAEGGLGTAMKVAAGAIAGAALAIPAGQIAKNAYDYGKGGGFSTTNSVSPMSMSDARFNNAWHDAAKNVEEEESVMEDGGGIHVSSYLDIDQLPEECIEDCSSSGDVSEAVEYWRKKLNFTVDRDRAIQCLAGYGSWDREELAASDDDQLADRILWLACCNFHEWDGKEGDSNSGSSQFYLE